MPKPKSLIGWCAVTVAVLLEAIEHVDFINSHLPQQLTKLINEPLIFVALLIGFGLVLVATREDRSESNKNSSEHKSVIPEAVPAMATAKRLNHNMQFTGAK